jgi:hypothetical protein
MQPARYELTNVWDNLSFPIPPEEARKMGYNFEYHPDGNLRFAGDLLNNKFDRSYSFDHVGRLQTASTAKGARGEPVGPGDEYQMPYSQTFSYDAFGNTMSRSGFLWHVPRSDSATYNNDRRQGWSYDNSGNVVDDATTGTHTYDCANRQVKFVSKATVGGFATGFPEEPAAEIEMSYDGDGSSVKRIETRREEVFGQPQPPPTSIDTIVTTTYYLRSSVLGMAAISEIGNDGLKKVGYVYDPAGERLAIQSGSGSVSWYHFPGGTGSWISTDNETNPFWSHYPTRHGLRTEMDPLGADVGVSDPFPIPLPEYNDRDRPLYDDGGDPFNYSFGCAWGGMPFSCSSSMRFLGDLAGPGFGTPPTFPRNIPSISWGSLGDLIFSKIRPPSIVNVDPITPPFANGFLPSQLYKQGKRLPGCVKDFFRRDFPNLNLDDIVIHTDGLPPIVKLFNSVPNGVGGFTFGNNIYFPEGGYHPDTNEGLAAIGHEIAHVNQFRKFGTPRFVAQYVGEYLKNIEKQIPDAPPPILDISAVNLTTYTNKFRQWADDVRNKYPNISLEKVLENAYENISLEQDAYRYGESLLNKLAKRPHPCAGVDKYLLR